VSGNLDISDVRVRFSIGGLLGRLTGAAGHVEAVCGVSFSLKRGEIMALVGESGSGKTTLARSIIGLQKIAAGSITFDGQEISALSDRQMKSIRRDIAMMFQDPIGSLSPRMTVRNLLAEPFRIHGISDKDKAAEVRRLLALVGLPTDFAERYPHQLSGGQARRIGVARALALDPKIIIADEPTAGLDVSVQGDILNLLRDLRDRLGLSILIITHNLSVVRRITDKMAVMYLGRFVEQGETLPVYQAPYHPYTAALLAAIPGKHANTETRLTLPANVPSLLKRPTGCEFHTRCPLKRDRCVTEAPETTRTDDGRVFTCHYPLNH
jgi:peptide/nickel transport system ATP-binding protein